MHAHPFKRLFIGVVTVAALSTTAFAIEDDGLRGRLMGSSSIDSIYTIDGTTTLVTGTAPDQIAGELEGFCTENGLTPERIEAKGDTGLAVQCGGIFTAENLEGKQINGKTVFTIKSSVEEPFAFKNSIFPPMDKLPTPENGRIPGNLSSLDLYQYMYALCKKDGGTPSTVITKRWGTTVRLAEAQDAEAFDYVFNSGDSRDPWYMECAGENRFLVEKNYKYNLYQDNAYDFHANRGLNGINYVQLETSKVASVDPKLVLGDKQRAEMSRYLRTSGLNNFSEIFEKK